MLVRGNAGGFVARGIPLCLSAGLTHPRLGLIDFQYREMRSALFLCGLLVRQLQTYKPLFFLADLLCGPTCIASLLRLVEMFFDFVVWRNTVRWDMRGNTAFFVCARVAQKATILLTHITLSSLRGLFWGKTHSSVNQVQQRDVPSFKYGPYWAKAHKKNIADFKLSKSTQKVAYRFVCRSSRAAIRSSSTDRQNAWPGPVLSLPLAPGRRRHPAFRRGLPSSPAVLAPDNQER